MTSAQRADITFLAGELVLDTNTGYLWRGDGSTAGGVIIAVPGAPPTGAAGGELTGTYPNPSVASSHSGSSHAAVQAAAEATAAAALSAHAASADPHTVYLLESLVSAFGLTLIDDADASAARTTLGLHAVAASGDHGALGGLSDDDHTIYAKADGTRDFTGNVRVRAASLPLIRLECSTSSDADGARSSAHVWKGQKADGTLHDMALLGAQHDGTGNDQKARVLLQVNSGSALATFATLYGTDLLALFAGEVRHTHGRLTHRYRSSQQTFSATATWKTVEWNGARDADTGFSWGGTNNDTCTVSFAGRVRIHFSASLHIDTLSTVAVANIRILKNGTLIPGSLRRADCIDTATLALIGGCTLAAEVVDTVAVNDTLTFEVRSESGSTLQVEADGASCTIQRLQGAS